METNLIAPKNWKSNSHWFEEFPEAARKTFVEVHCRNVRGHLGQACVIISYPREDSTVAVYDMDAGQIFWLEIDELDEYFDEILRSTEEADYEWNAISGTMFTDESHDISALLFDTL